MATTTVHWLIPQIERLARFHPNRLDDLLEAIREARPDLYGELTLMALEHGELNRHQAAVNLESEDSEVDALLEHYRDAMEEVTQRQIITKDSRGVARIEGRHVTVWEVVREYRAVHSVEAMHDAFPSLSEAELRAALVYAGRNPDEIGAQIQAFEDILERSKAAYPFAK